MLRDSGGRIFGCSKTRILLSWPVLSLILVAPVFIGHATRAFAEDSDQYAFLRNGDLWLQYKGQVQRLTKAGDYKDFAVANDGSYLALLRTVEAKPSIAQVVLVSMADQRPPATLEVPTTTGLIATCDTIASLENKTALHRRVAIARDLIANKILSDQEYVDFRCNSDRRVTMGYTRSADRNLTVRGMLPANVALDYVPHLFDLSPDDRFAAFFYGAARSLPSLRLADSRNTDLYSRCERC